MMTRWIFIFVLLFIPGEVWAQNHLITVDLAEDHIDITTGFNGAKLVLFGVQEQPGDIAIVFSGPRDDMVVRRKENVSGMWMNRSSMDFDDVPVYYDYALAVPEKDLATAKTLKKEMIGLEALRFEPVDGEENIAEFQDALVRNRQAMGMFPEKPQEITFINDHFFRTTFYIPPNVPRGEYQIKTYLMGGGKVRGVKTMNVRVAQVGVSAGVYRFAHRHSIAYGFLCVVFAMAVGWVSTMIRRQA